MYGMSVKTHFHYYLNNSKKSFFGLVWVLLLKTVSYLIHIFYKNTMLIFAQNLRTIPSSTEEQSFKFSI